MKRRKKQTKCREEVFIMSSAVHLTTAMTQKDFTQQRVMTDTYIVTPYVGRTDSVLAYPVCRYLIYTLVTVNY